MKELLLSFLGLVGILLIPSSSSAQISVTFPQERAVFQRDMNGYATVSVSGTYFKAADKIEVRAKAVLTGQGNDIDWTVIDDEPDGGIFTGAVSLSQGWYSLEIRASLSGNIIGGDTISRVGVGEVFIISGQSNAQGVEDLTQLPLPPGASDDRVNYVDYNNEAIHSLDDPPIPVFRQLQLQGNDHILGPRGHTAWCWGLLGDLLAQKLNVPVLFINTAWSGTSIQNWLESSRGIETYSVYSDLYKFPPGMPYANLRLSVQNYAHQYGARAILWMLGESDTFPMRMNFEDFKSKLETVIKSLTSATNVKIPWMIARTSRNLDAAGMSITSQAIIDAQNAVIQELGEMTAAGPETDDLPVTRIDGIHFYGADALQVLASAWSERLSPEFFAGHRPLLSRRIGKITSRCSSANNTVTLRLPDGYNSYIWSLERDGLVTEQNGQSLNVSLPGNYSARLKDQFGNTLRTETVIVPTGVKPSKPVIRELGSHQVCNDSSFTFSVPFGQDQYQWYKEGEANVLHTGFDYLAKESGTYFVKALNVWGCYSEDSDPVSLTVRDKISPAVIVKNGPFSVRAAAPETGENRSYSWSLDSQVLPDSNDVITVNAPGIYAVKIKQVFNLGEYSSVCYSSASNEIIIEPEMVNDNFAVFPNPGEAGAMFVESKTDSENAVLIVYDILGRVINKRQVTFERFVRVPISVPDPGKYILQITSGQTTRKIHFVIK